MVIPVLLPLLVFPILFFIAQSEQGSTVGGSIFASLFFGVILFWLIKNLLLRPVAAFMNNKTLKQMQSELPALGIQNTLSFASRKPTPSLIVVDKANKQIYVSVLSKNYQRMTLQASQIVGAKIERQSIAQTTTTKSGAPTIFSNAGFAYTFSSRSKSTTKTKEMAFLEIHYQYQKDGAPNFVVVPFGENRREADSILVAINQITQ